MFFVVSGFYMQLVLSTRYTEKVLGPGWVRTFYEARYFRLLPMNLTGAALAVLATTLDQTLDPMPAWDAIRHLPASTANLIFVAFLSLTNLTMFFQEAVMFLGVHAGQVHWTSQFAHSEIVLWNALAVPQAWSLGIEISFYALAPFLLNLRLPRMIALAACSLGLKFILVRSLHLADPWTYQFFPFELGYFLLGALAYRYSATLQPTHKTMTPRIALALYLTIALFVTVRLSLPLSTTAYPLVLAAALPYIFRTTAKSEADRWIGELSYPFYIFHYLAIAVASRVLSGDVAAWGALLFTFILSAATFTLERRLIEPWRSRLALRRNAIIA